MDLTSWKFDIRTAVIMVVVVPLLTFLFKIVLKNLKRWSGYLLEGGMYWFSRSIMHSLAGALTLKRYCRLQLSGSNRYLHVPSRLDIKLDIDTVYVTLTLERHGDAQGKYTHADLFRAGNRIRVIGDPGSGKSSLVKRLFRDACHKGTKRPNGAQLPFFLELKNLEIPVETSNDRLGKWFLQKLRNDSQKSAVYQMGECFDSYAETAGLLVLLDGLDEVSTHDYPRVQMAIQQLSHELARLSEQNNMVLTMRTQFHQQTKDIYRDSFELAMFLKAFSPSDIYQFLTRWPFEDNADQIISRIYNDLTDRPSLREMCSNPLILSMYVADDQAAGHLLAPETRTEFYSKVTEELIIRRRLKQTGVATAYTKLREQREQILGRIAYEHLLNFAQPTNSLQWSEAIDIVRQIIGCSESDAETLFREMAKETGLITEERPSQSFRFIHLTFCEFLAAFEAVQGQTSGWSTLINAQREIQADRHLRARLVEVIPFACGLLPRVKRYDTLTEVMSLADNNLLALSFLETKAYDHKSWPKFVELQQEVLVNTPEEEWDDQWLRKLHLFSVVIRDANNSAVHLPLSTTMPELSVFFKTLVAKQKASLSTLLAAYATQDAAAAFRLAEICNLDLAVHFPEIIISNCDQPPFLALVREQVLHEMDRIDAWAPLLTEAGLRSRIVATTLMNSRADTRLDIVIGKLPKTARWFYGSRLPKTLYTQLITIACRIPRKVEQTKMLHSLQTLPPPGTINAQSRREILFMAAFFSCVAALMLTFLFWGYHFPPLVISQVGIILLMAAPVRMMGKRAQLIAGYSALLQLAGLSANAPEAEVQSDRVVAKRIIYTFSPKNIFDFLGKPHRGAVRELLRSRMPSIATGSLP